jgi:hypothetical protein
LKLAQDGRVSEGVAAATHVAFDRPRRGVKVVLVSDGISRAEAQKIGIAATHSFPEGLSTTVEVHGHSARIGVVTQGADIMAQFETTHRR